MEPSKTAVLYIHPDEAAHMPGRESTSTGEWMRLIENGGYQHVM